MRILEMNYQNRYGGIDLIAKDGEILVFVEVKTWETYGYSDLEYAVGREKRRKIVAVAREYLSRWEEEPPFCRFDLIFIPSSVGNFEYIQNAFTETGKL